MSHALDPTRFASIFGEHRSCSRISNVIGPARTNHHRRGGSGPVFIHCRHLESPNRADRLPTAHWRSRERTVGTNTERAVTTLHISAALDFARLSLARAPTVGYE